MPRFLRLTAPLFALVALGVAQAPNPPARSAAPAPAMQGQRPAVPTAKTVTARSGTTASAVRKGKGKKNNPAAHAQAPLPPPRPDQLPATRPTVTYHHGQLSILANNATMADVLSQVRTQTGAQFEMTGVSGGDRVYAKLGPGAPKDVLAALLEGSRFNFAILGSPTDPAAVARVVLMPRSAAAGPVVASAPVSRPAPQPQMEEELPEEEMQPEEAPPAPAEEQQIEQQGEPQQQQQQQNPGQPKTPEQLLQELQQMQQQQQNQQQNPPQQNPPEQPIPDREIPD
jgi:hypothetical protein